MSISELLGELKDVSLPQGTVRYRERGSGQPMVFVHGVFVNGDLWRKVVPELAGEYRCITPDLPLGGHELPLNSNADLTPHGVANLLADFMAALDLDDVTLVANDTGGAISQLLITTRPERIGRLVLTTCDAFNEFPPLLLKPLPFLARIPGYMLVSSKVMETAPVRVPLMWSVTNAKVDRAIQRSYLHPAASNAGVRRDLQEFLRASTPRLTQAAAKLLPNFDRPVLIAWSTDDIFFSKKSARRLADTFPDARLEWIEDSRLFSPEDQPQALARLVDEFVKERAAAPVAKEATA